MRLIDADEFEKDINKCFRYSNTTLINNYEVLHRLNNAPTIDAVEVVRCKDCRYYEGKNTYCANDILATPYDYCSRGERRE